MSNTWTENMVLLYPDNLMMILLNVKIKFIDLLVQYDG